MSCKALRPSARWRVSVARARMSVVMIAVMAGFTASASAQCPTCGGEGVVGAAGSGCLGGGCGLLDKIKGRCATCGCEENEGDGTHCGMPAPSYPVPFATPKNVSRTNFTYPPMMPHHSLPNYAGTYSFRHGPGMSRTNVYWRPSYLINAGQWLHNLIEIPR